MQYSGSASRPGAGRNGADMPVPAASADGLRQGGRTISEQQIGQNPFGLVLIEIGPVAFSDTVIGKQVIFRRRDIVTGEAIAHAGQCAAVDRDDAPPGFGDPHQLGNVTADPGNTGHFGMSAPV